MPPACSLFIKIVLGLLWLHRKFWIACSSCAKNVMGNEIEIALNA